ncbi:helix-turn-helix domain-containing protein [Sodalis sp. RH21]|uniref:helix-turn-helix domain-containing protein n=1 Tax=unclassified Sodalis (in: enterobacteria) TaxID=2636512 RepID=UPI0039B4B6DC
MILLSKTLRYFIITAQEQSIRLAAMILCITPSPLCRTIKIFELNLGHKLFTRTNTGLKLTSYGHDLYDKLLPLYLEMCDLEKSLIKKDDIRKKKILQFKVGLDHHDYSYLAPLFSASIFQKENNNVSLEYFSPEEKNINELLRNGSCQIFFTQKKIQCQADVEHVNLPNDIIMMVTQMGAAINDTSPTEALSGKTLVQYESSAEDNILRDINSYLSKNKISLKRLNIPELYVQLSMIEKGDAIGLMPSSVKNIIDERNYKIKLSPFIFEQKNLTIERNVYFLKSDKTFIENNILPIIELEGEYLLD